jgi:threonine aldolase
LALRDGPARLADDHAHARRIAAALAGNRALEIDPATIDTNIGFFHVRPRDERDLRPADRWCRAAGEAGVLMSTLDGVHVRFVTHRDVDVDGVERAVAIVGRLAA